MPQSLSSGGIELFPGSVPLIGLAQVHRIIRHFQLIRIAHER